MSRQTIGGWFFRWRDVLPVPLVLWLMKVARPRPLGWLCGLPLVFAGEALRLWGLQHIGPTTRTREICADRLVTTGPYRFCRNPLYVANLLKVFGLLVIAGDAAFFCLVLGFYACEYGTMIPFEEAFLAKMFPEAHAAWAAEVPAFLPRSEPFGEARPGGYSLAEAMISERRTFASTGLLLGLLGLLGLQRTGGLA